MQVELIGSTIMVTYLAFSDHHSLVVTICLPDPLSKLICPKSQQPFRLRDEVINDNLFQQSLSEAMVSWKNVRAFGMDTLPWWELVVKPGVRKLGMLRGRQMLKDSRAELNLRLVRQAYLNMKVKLGNTSKLGELHTVHRLIKTWYEKECEKVKNQSRIPGI